MQYLCLDLQCLYLPCLDLGVQDLLTIEYAFRQLLVSVDHLFPFFCWRQYFSHRAIFEEYLTILASFSENFFHFSQISS